MKAEVKSTAVSKKTLTQFSENTITKTRTTVTGEVLDATDNFFNFIMQRLSGRGVAFLEIDGSAVEYELQAGQKIVVDTGNLAICDETCDIDIESVKGVKNVLLGGEGIFHTVVTGPGRVTLQTMSMNEFVRMIADRIPQNNS